MKNVIQDVAPRIVKARVRFWGLRILMMALAGWLHCAFGSSVAFAANSAAPVASTGKSNKAAGKVVLAQATGDPTDVGGEGPANPVNQTCPPVSTCSDNFCSQAGGEGRCAWQLNVQLNTTGVCCAGHDRITYHFDAKQCVSLGDDIPLQPGELPCPAPPDDQTGCIVVRNGTITIKDSVDCP